MDLQSFYGKVPRPLLWAGSRPGSGTATASGIPNGLNYHVIFIVHTKFINVFASRIIQPAGLRVAEQCRTVF